MQEQYHKWHAQYLNKDFEMLVFGNSGFPLIFFPPAYGRYYDAKNFGLISSVEKYIDAGQIRIYCPDSFDSQSLCNYSITPAERIKMNNLFEKMILNDVIDFAAFETGTKKVGLSGCDFGGYHALNIAMRYPHKVSKLITMGGFFDIRRFIYGHYDDDAYYNNPTDYLPNLEDEWYLDKIRIMQIILGVGDWDQYLGESKRMSEIFFLKEINHLLDVRIHLSHDWSSWYQLFPIYVDKVVREQNN
jgi:esterase/lipase superfamily enzyme